jgi:hypothetical protein
VLAQYYSIPWLSYRDAVWHEYFANTPGFKRYEIFPVDEERHPTPLGHRCGPLDAVSVCLPASAAVPAHTAHHNQTPSTAQASDPRPVTVRCADKSCPVVV